MTSSPADEQHLRDLKLLRRVRDRMDREYARPLNVALLRRGNRSVTEVCFAVGCDCAVPDPAGTMIRIQEVR